MAGTLTRDQILDGISELSVLELSELLKEFEERFGVTAAAPVAVAAAPRGRRGRRRGRGGGEERVRRHPHRGRRQEDPGHQGGPLAHEPRAEGGQGPRRRAPKPVLEKVNKDDAEKAKAALEAAGRHRRAEVTAPGHLSAGGGREGEVLDLGPPGSLGCRSSTDGAWAPCAGRG